MSALPPAEPTQAVSDEAIHRAEEFVEAEEGAHNRLKGLLADFVIAAAVAMSLFHLSFC